MYIAVEGIDGSGKTTVCHELHRAFVSSGLFEHIVCTREPGSTALGISLKQMLCDPSKPPVDPTAEILLFAADRAQHVADVIRPARQQGALIISDRCVWSTIAYQGYGRGGHIPMITQVNKWVLGVEFIPDLIIYLDIDPSIASERCHRRDGECGSTFEQCGPEFLQRVITGYRTLKETDKSRVVVVNANLPMTQVLKFAIAGIEEHMKLKRIE